MYAAPLSVMGEVLRSKSTQYMPLLPTLCVILVSTLWLAWSLIASDMFVLLPNAVSAARGAVGSGAHRAAEHVASTGRARLYRHGLHTQTGPAPCDLPRARAIRCT